jgi:probable HAF family extracellular repeat protein
MIELIRVPARHYSRPGAVSQATLRAFRILASRLFLVISLLLGTVPVRAEPPLYSLTRVTSGYWAYGSGLNNAGDIVGTANVDSTANSKHHAFIWYYKTRTLRDVGTVGGSNSEGAGINDCQEVVGTSDLKGDKIRHAYVYYQGYGADLDQKGAGSRAASINNAGTIVGTATFNNEQRPALFVAKTGAVKDLIRQGGYASAISLSGEIVGARQPNNNSSIDPRAFIYADGAITDLDPRTPHGDSAIAINDHLDVVGVWYGLKNSVPFLYRDGVYGGVIDVGAPFLWDTAHATGINNAGDVVGNFGFTDSDGVGHMSAFLSRGGVTYLLENLIDPTDPLARFVSIKDPDGINDSGWIVANGIDSRTGTWGVYLLTVKDPAIQLQRVTGGCSHH